jgi:hypothetical protein
MKAAVHERAVTTRVAVDLFFSCPNPPNISIALLRAAEKNDHSLFSRTGSRSR